MMGQKGQMSHHETPTTVSEYEDIITTEDMVTHEVATDSATDIKEEREGFSPVNIVTEPDIDAFRFANRTEEFIYTTSAYEDLSTTVPEAPEVEIVETEQSLDEFTGEIEMWEMLTTESKVEQEETTSETVVEVDPTTTVTNVKEDTTTTSRKLSEAASLSPSCLQYLQSVQGFPLRLL